MERKKTFTSKKEITLLTISFLLLITIPFSYLFAQDFGVPSRTTVGVGARAFAMGNNYIALSDDVTAMFWNPAGLAFTPVREFQASLNCFSHHLNSEFNSTPYSEKIETDRQRVHFSNVGLLRAFPTTRGGFALAFGFQSPYLLDERIKYNVQKSSVEEENLNYYAHGQMNLWTSAFGIQIAQDFGVGAAVSFVSGKNRMAMDEKYSSIGSLYSEFESTIEQKYLGCDIRFGLMYSILEVAKIGMRIIAPQFLVFKENWDEEGFVDDDTSTVFYSDSDELKGILKSSFSFAIGFSYKLPFVLLCADFNARSPIPEAKENTNYSYWNIGGGAGFELPLFGKSVLLRGGYSVKEFDKHPLLIEYDEPPDYFDPNVKADSDFEHLVTTGIAYLNQSGISFDISYGYNFWNLSWYHRDFGGSISEVHSSHRVTASFALRY